MNDEFLRTKRLLKDQSISKEFRFWMSIERSNLDSCWNWIGMSIKGRAYYERTHAARIVYEKTFDVKLKEKECVCHKCDNPICVNPFHLFLGTQSENMQDMINKGRHHSIVKYGSENKRSKLTDDMVLEIRALWSRNYTHDFLSKKYNVSKMTIYSVCRKKMWKHVPESSPEEIKKILNRLSVQ